MSHPSPFSPIAGVPDTLTTAVRAPGNARPQQGISTGTRASRDDRQPPVPHVLMVPQLESRPRRTGNTGKRPAYHNKGEAGHLPGMPHEPVARATVLWDWDGIILNSMASGLPVKEGNKVYICNVVDANWYQIIHQDSCKYIPRAFVQVEGVYEKRFQSQFRVPANHLGVKTPPQPPSPPPPTPPPRQGLFAVCCGSRPEKPSRGPRPEIPSPPYPTDHHVTDSHASQTTVGLSHTRPSPQEKGSGLEPDSSCCSWISLSWAHIRRRWIHDRKRGA